MLRMTPLPARHDPRRFRSASNCFLRWFVLVAVPLPRVYFPPTYAMHFAVGCALISSVGAATTPEASAKRSFDLPSGEAAAVFKQFIAQSRVQLLYVADDATSVRTNAVKGAFTPREAIDRILAGTSLIAVQTDSGSIAVKKLAPQVRPRISPTPISPPAKPAEPTANPRNQTNAPQTPMKSPKLLSILSLLAFGAAEASAQTAPVAPATSETVELSPFMVTSEKDAGYYGANTLSGTRMNAKLEDLGASITVITKQQMTDLALLNMDDIFAYEASTEGTATFTNFSFDRNGSATDNTQYDPLTANRIRGVGNANVSFGNFETSGRTPIDVLEVDAVELGRGPNSNIFGIGNAAGTVNTVRASANLSKSRSQVSARYDSFGGYRTSLDLNRVLKPGVLAIRGSAVGQRDGFQLKPSGYQTERYNGMIRFNPFKTTSISGSFSYYHSYGNRPNTTTPRESITAWRNAGSPTWDPVTASATINGVTTVGLPSVLNRDRYPGNSVFLLDQNGMFYWGPSRSGLSSNTSTGPANPASQNGPAFFEAPALDPSGYRVSQPLVNDFPPLASKAIYDWTRINLAAPNHQDDKSEIASVLIDQSLLSTGRQNAFVQLGWFREQTDRYVRNVIAGGTLSQAILQVDVNKNLLDGRPNPGFLRPFINNINQTVTNPLDRDTYRAQLAYRLDFTRDRSWLRWLGRHELGAFTEYKDFKSWSRTSRDAIIDDHPWLNNAVRAAAGLPMRDGRTLPQGTTMALPNFFFYMGDNQGQNVDYAPFNYQTPGVYPFTWGVNSAGQMVTEQARLAPAYNGSSRSWQILKSRGAILQSHFLDDRVVTTLGLRHDARYAQANAPIYINPDGYTVDEKSFLSFPTTDWLLSKGPTRNIGIVLKPVKWFSVFANKSDSFQPATIQTDIYLKNLPDPSGTGKDYGFALNLFSGKLVIRANQYDTRQLRSRTGNAGIIATRIIGVDHIGGINNLPVTSFAVYQLQQQAIIWANAAAAAQGQTLTPSELNTRVAAIMQMPVSFLNQFQYSMTATQDVIAKGREIELNYNPTKFWTLKLNVAESESIQGHIGKEVAQYLAERMKVWQSIIDPINGQPWFTFRYPNTSQTQAQDVAANIIAPLNLALATEGLSNPQIRKYRANATTNFQLAGITENSILKRINVGGALRWEDKGAIGYWGKQQLPAVITDYDPTRPIYDKAHLYVDAFAGYRTRLFGNKVGTTFQFNVRNLTEGGRLQPIAADADGSIAAWRIVSRRQFIFTTTFDF